MRSRAILALVASASLHPGAFAQAPAAQEALLDEPGRARWEAGLAVGAGRVADYPGADQAHARAIALPVFIYRGPVLRVDEQGIRGRFVDTPEWEFNLTGTAAFNAKSNDARQGMARLDYLLGVGPQAVYKGLRGGRGATTLHLKLRALVSTDLRHVDGRGFSFDPELRWRLPRVAGSASALTLSLQPTWATRALHRYFYQVDPSEATPVRPAYAARAGYLGSEASATLSRSPSRSVSWFVTARVMSLHGAANTASPLLRSRSNVNVGAGLVWTPWQSRERADERWP
jgi:outer membrane scaffolding protein for murein synthesis (MipA/OmpV family)